MIKNTDILIVGAGVSGLLVALELCLAGRTVTILEKSQVGRESSWAGGGILLPIYPWRQAEAISELVIKSLDKFPDLAERLKASTGIDAELRSCGMLICKNPDVNAALTWCQKYHVAVQTAPQAKTEALQTVLQDALWLPEISQIRNPRFLQALQAFLAQKGVTFVENVEINRVVIKDRFINRLETNIDTYSLNQLVICAGAWTAEFLQNYFAVGNTGLKLAIQPIKGQMLVFDAKPNTLAHMILDGDQYLIPRRDGRILAGSTVEQAGFDKNTTETARQKLSEFAINLMPILKQFEISHHWAGLRPGTPDGIPYIGKHPDYDNLSINAGHFRNGLVMGPASAELLADRILERSSSLNVQAYAINRNRYQIKLSGI
jgi:glycine oxidase